MRFTDRTGRPGPRDWENGKFPAGEGGPSRRRRLLVRGRWPTPAGSASGCRRPPSGRRPGAGPSSSRGGDCNRYPWGDLFDPARANLWPSGIRGTVPGRAISRRRHSQRHLPDDRQRLGMARRPPGDDPQRGGTRPSIPGGPCAGSSAAPSTLISPAKPPASSLPDSPSSTAARTSDSGAPSRSTASGHSPKSERSRDDTIPTRLERRA